MTGVRDRVCACLRDPTPIVQSLPSDVMAYARGERIELLLGYRLALHELADELRAAVALEAAREHELQAVLGALAESGVEAVVLKGAAIARTHYPRPELRPRSDTDLMIPARDREATVQTLLALGYRQPSEVDGALTTGQCHLQRFDRRMVPHALDVHWRISNVRAFADVLTYEELRRDAVAMPTLGPHALSPSAVHALLIACVHRVAHHGDTDCLLWLFDVDVLARGLSADEGHTFSALAAARGMRAVCASTLDHARTAFGGIDAHWIHSLRDGGIRDEPSAAFLGARLRQIDVLTADLRATPRLADRLRVLLEHLFPRPGYMLARYGARFPLVLPFLYLHRAVSGAPKWFRR